MFQADLDVSQLARENEILREYTHINTLLLEIGLEHKRVQNVVLNTELPTIDTYKRDSELIQQLFQRKEQFTEIILSFLSLRK